MTAIYTQLPEKSPSAIMKVLRRRLKEEEHFEEVNKQPSFRALLLRNLIKEIENLR